MTRNNYHTHTVLCDGFNTPEELVLEAIAKGCTEIGFTGHSFTDIYDEEPFCMSKENTEKYICEINRLKSVYADKIRIYLAVEQDYYSDCSVSPYEYVIGSVHYVLKDGYYIPVDETKEIQINAVNKYYGGDFYAFAEDYYELAGDLYNKTKCNIVGHFDIITKYNENGDLFDTKNERYIRAYTKALNKLMNKGLYFEINYGAVAGGYRSEPFPEQSIVDILKANGEKIICSSDCHHKEKLLLGIEKENILKI